VSVAHTVQYVLYVTAKYSTL